MKEVIKKLITRVKVGVKRTINRFGLLVEYGWVYGDFELYRWDASKLNSISISMDKKKSGIILKDYIIKVDAYDSVHTMRDGSSRHFEFALEIRSILSEKTIRRLLNGAYQFGVLEEDGRSMLKVCKGDKNYVVNYTCPVSRTTSYDTMKYMDLSGIAAKHAKTVDFGQSVISI